MELFWKKGRGGQKKKISKANKRKGKVLYIANKSDPFENNTDIYQPQSSSCVGLNRTVSASCDACVKLSLRVLIALLIMTNCMSLNQSSSGPVNTTHA